MTGGKRKAVTWLPCFVKNLVKVSVQKQKTCLRFSVSFLRSYKRIRGKSLLQFPPFIHSCSWQSVVKYCVNESIWSVRFPIDDNSANGGNLLVTIYDPNFGRIMTVNIKSYSGFPLSLQDSALKKTKTASFSIHAYSPFTIIFPSHSKLYNRFSSKNVVK